MNSATKVGEIFTKAGESFHKMADMTMMLDAKAQDLNVTSVKKQVRLSPVLIFFDWSKNTFSSVVVAIYGAKLGRLKNLVFTILKLDCSNFVKIAFCQKIKYIDYQIYQLDELYPYFANST